jgi:hypothetical protein
MPQQSGGSLRPAMTDGGCHLNHASGTNRAKPGAKTWWQRAALFNLLEKCGDRPAATTMQRSSRLLHVGTFSIVGAS